MNKSFSILVAAVLVLLIQATMVTAIVTPLSAAMLLERSPQLTTVSSPLLDIRGGSSSPVGEGSVMEATQMSSILSAVIPSEMAWAKGMVVLSLLGYSVLAFDPDILVGGKLKSVVPKLKRTKMSPVESIRARGAAVAGLSVAVTSALLLVLSNKKSPWTAVVIGALPRYIHLAILLLSAKELPQVDISSLVPVYGVLGVLFAAMVTEVIPIQPALAAKIVGGIYTFAGFVCMLVPTMVAQETNKKGPNNEFDTYLVRELAKADLINGGLLWGVGMGYTATKSIGAAQLAWLLAVLAADIAPRLLSNGGSGTSMVGNTMGSVILQFVLAGVGSKLLFFSSG